MDQDNNIVESEDVIQIIQEDDSEGDQEGDSYDDDEDEDEYEDDDDEDDEEEEEEEPSLIIFIRTQEKVIYDILIF